MHIFIEGKKYVNYRVLTPKKSAFYQLKLKVEESSQNYFLIVVMRLLLGKHTIHDFYCHYNVLLDAFNNFD